jgi:hypothetical protein
MTPAAFATASPLVFLTSFRQKERGLSEDTLLIAADFRFVDEQNIKPLQGGICPFWVKSAVWTVSRPLPVFPGKRTFSESFGMSQTCQ